MSLDDDVEVVRLATRFSDMSRDEQAEAAFDRILARLEAAEKRAQVLEAEHEAAGRYLFDQSPDNLDDFADAYDAVERGE